MVPFIGGAPKSTLRATAKLAVHVALAPIVTVHVGLLPQPAQAPPHPTRTYPGSGIAINVTGLPSAKFAEHAELPEPQFIPAGIDTIVPFAGGVPKETVVPPAPPPLAVKLALHVLLAVIVKVHVVLVPQPAQSPPHPAKT